MATMMSRRAKAIFYLTAGPFMKVNGAIYRAFRAPKCGNHKVHLGPGQKNYLKGWINIDANMFTGRCDVWANLINPLPFDDNTIEAMYSHHMVEHLPDIDRHFKDVYRCLKRGGAYRVGGPNGDTAAKKLLEGDVNWFSEFPEARKSVGGRYNGFLFCKNEHLSVLTFSFLEELMANVGFVDIRACLPTRETSYPALFGECLEKEFESNFEVPHTLIVEGRKAG